MLSNADHLLLSVLTQVLLTFLANMEILATPGIQAVSSTSSFGELCSQQGWCPISCCEQAQRFHVQVKHSASNRLSTAYCFNNPSLLLRAFCRLNSGCSLQGWSLTEMCRRKPSSSLVRGPCDPSAARCGGNVLAYFGMVGKVVTVLFT